MDAQWLDIGEGSFSVWFTCSCLNHFYFLWDWGFSLMCSLGPCLLPHFFLTNDLRFSEDAADDMRAWFFLHCGFVMLFFHLVSPPKAKAIRVFCTDEQGLWLLKFGSVELLRVGFNVTELVCDKLRLLFALRFHKSPWRFISSRWSFRPWRQVLEDLSSSRRHLYFTKRQRWFLF